MKRLTVVLICLLIGPLIAAAQIPDWGSLNASVDVAHVTARNPDVDTATDPEDLIGWGGLYGGFAITNADTVVILSSSADDTLNGSGAWMYTVEGLSAGCRLVTVSDTLTGTTPDTVSTSMYRVLRTYVTAAGTGGTNAGNITVRTPSDSVLSYVTAGLGQSKAAVYTIPADYSEALLTNFWSGNDKGPGTVGNVQFYLQMRPQNGAWRTIETWGDRTDLGLDRHPLGVPVSVPACADLRLRVQEVTQDNTQVYGGFDLWLMR